MSGDPLIDWAIVALVVSLAVLAFVGCWYYLYCLCRDANGCCGKDDPECRKRERRH